MFTEIPALKWLSAARLFYMLCEIFSSCIFTEQMLGPVLDELDLNEEIFHLLLEHNFILESKDKSFKLYKIFQNT